KKNTITMKKEVARTRPIHRVNLTLPVIRTQSYEIYCTAPSSSPPPPVSCHQPLDNNYHKSSTIQKPRIRSPGHLRHLTGPLMASLYIDTPFVPIQSSSSSASSSSSSSSSSILGNTISNVLINSGYSEQALRDVSTMLKRTKVRQKKDTVKQSQMSTESLNDSSGTKHNVRQTIHLPQLTKVKILHQRKTFMNSFNLSDVYLRVPNTSSMGNLAEEDTIPSVDHVQDRIEKLTKAHFPTIQQLRHEYRCPELVSNRMRLHREGKTDSVLAATHTHLISK
ncbi:unnamed protein product, partial [Adineta ricciae]